MIVCNVGNELRVMQVVLDLHQWYTSTTVK